MIDTDPSSTFRGLPLTPEQNAEVKHFIKVKKQHGEPWDTPELKAMLRDMLDPPGEDDEAFGVTAVEAMAAAERASAAIDEEMEPIEAREQLKAAMEYESMKGSRY